MNFYKTKFTIFLTFVAFLCLLNSCVPTYKTTYDFEPPDDDGGLRCVFQCETVQSQCMRIQRLEREKCRSRNDTFYYQCVERNRNISRNNRRACFRGSCPFPDFSRCKAAYRRCFKNCGGTVTGTTVCTSNCDKIDEKSKP